MLNQTPHCIRLIINGTEYRVRPDGNLEDSRGLARPPGVRAEPALPEARPPGLRRQWQDQEAGGGEGPLPGRQFAFSRRTALVSLDVVRAVLGVDAVTVASLVDSGELAWVFDVSATKSSQRELRFWTRELFAPEQCRMSPTRALQMILGKGRQRWRGSEIEQLLLASRASILRWNRAGDLPGETVDHTFWVTREALTGFLKSRLCQRGEN